MPQPEPEMKSPGLNWVWMPLSGLACGVTLPLRYSEGLYGVSRSGLFAVVVIFGYALLVPCPPLLTYGLFFVAVCVLKRFSTVFRFHFGNRQKSEYEGLPIYCLIGIPEWVGKQIIEPGLAWMLGQYLKHYNHPLGLFFMAGAIATALKTLFEIVVQLNRDTAASDIEAQMRIDAQRRAKRGW